MVFSAVNSSDFRDEIAWTLLHLAIDLAQLFWDLYILYFEIYYLILSNIPGLGYFALCVAVLLLDRLDRRDD